MTTYHVLFLLVLTTNGVAVNTSEHYTKKDCVRAGQAALKHFAHEGKVGVKYFCTSEVRSN